VTAEVERKELNSSTNIEDEKRAGEDNKY